MNKPFVVKEVSGTWPETLTDVIETLGSCANLSERQRADLKSAIRCFGRVTGLDLATTAAADLKLLQDRTAQAAPLRFGLSAKRWSVIRSQLQRALNVTGAARPLQTAGVRLTPTWEAFLSRLPSLRSRVVLSRFARFCILSDLEPADVTAETLDDFHRVLTEESLVRWPDRIAARARAAWVRASKIAPPSAIASSAGSCKKTRAPRLPLTTFPQSFKDEVLRFQRWCGTADPLDEAARPKALRAQTVISYSSALHTGAAAAIRAGRSVASIRSLHDLVVPESYLLILRQLMMEWDQQASPTLHQVATVLVIVAKDWCQVSPDRLAELKRLRSKLPREAAGLTDKNRKLLALFEDRLLLQRLILLPDVLWRRARDEKRPVFQRLHCAQMALLIDILLIAPLRRRSICRVRFGHHLTWPNGPKGAAMLNIPADDMKTGVEYVAELPVELSRRLHHYQTVLAPQLIGRPAEYLFENTDGTPKSEASVAAAVSLVLWKRLGIRMTMHQFRHLCTKLLLDANPGAFATASQLLGHASEKYVLRFYGGTDTKRASRHHAGLIERLREEAKARPAKRRDRSPR